VSDLGYNLIWGIGVHAFWVSSKPVVLHLDRLKRPGAYILAPTHLSVFDVPCLMAIAPRNLDFVSIVEVFRNPIVAAIYGFTGFTIARVEGEEEEMEVALAG
jgi:1-acyl-sn-glycerol-3-phosphate acyltransferase